MVSGSSTRVLFNFDGTVLGRITRSIASGLGVDVSHWLDPCREVLPMLESEFNATEQDLCDHSEDRLPAMLRAICIRNDVGLEHSNR